MEIARGRWQYHSTNCGKRAGLAQHPRGGAGHHSKRKKACTLTNKTIVANYCGLSSLGLTVGCGLAVDAWEGRERLWALFRGKGFEGHNLLHIPAQARAQGLQLDIRAARRQAHDKLHHGNRQNHEFRNVEDNRKQHHE